MELYMVKFWITSIVLLIATNAIDGETSNSTSNNQSQNEIEIDCLNKAESCCNRLFSTYKLRINIQLSKYITSCKKRLCNDLLNEEVDTTKLAETCERAEGYVYNGSDIAILMRFEKNSKLSPQKSQILLEGLVESPQFNWLGSRTLQTLFFNIPYDGIISIITNKDFPITSKDVFDLLWCGTIYRLYEKLINTYSSNYYIFIKVKWIVVTYCHANKILDVDELMNLYNSAYGLCYGPKSRNDYEKVIEIWITAFLDNNLNASDMCTFLERLGYSKYLLELSMEPQASTPGTRLLNWSLKLAIELSKTSCMKRENEIDYKCQLELVYLAYNLKSIHVSPRYIVADLQSIGYNPNYVNLLNKLSAETIENYRRARCISHADQIYIFYYICKLKNNEKLNFKTLIIEKLNTYNKTDCAKFMNNISDAVTDYEKYCSPHQRKQAHCIQRADDMWKNAFP